VTYAQFDIYSALANQEWEGGSIHDGNPILHAPLTNPLDPTLGGTYCRRFNQPQRPTSSYWGSGTIFAGIKTDIDGGKYDAPDDTIALDLRFHSRLENDTGRAGNIGVFCRSFLDTAHSSGNDANAAPEAFDGYGMSYGPVRNLGNEGLMSLRLWARRNMNAIGNNAAYFQESIFTTNPVTAGGWIARTWYRFRFVFNPIANLQHVLIAYVLNALNADESNPANWTEVGRITLTSAFSATFNPRAAGQRVGFYTCQAPHELGVTGPNMLFDNFVPRWAFVG
jgi:hypothetical protein